MHAVLVTCRRGRRGTGIWRPRGIAAIVALIGANPRALSQPMLAQQACLALDAEIGQGDKISQQPLPAPRLIHVWGKRLDESERERESGDWMVQ